MLLAVSGTVLIAGLAALPLPFAAGAGGDRVWPLAAAAALVSAVLVETMRRLARRLVYPGAPVDDATLALWRDALTAAPDLAALTATASRLLSRHLRMAVSVRVGPQDRDPAEAAPVLALAKRAGRWQVEAIGWDGAPPGPRQTAALFATAVVEAAARLDQAMIAAETERRHQHQARLAELGLLAATVAHDLRHPLNIIAMAATGAAEPARREIAIQVGRIARLTQDLLDYAETWRIEPQALDLADLIRSVAAPYPEVEIGPGLDAPLPMTGDPRRLRRVLVNLLDNARSAGAADAPHPRIGVAAERDREGAVRVHIRDTGAGIPAEIRDRVFQPFVSRSPEGTGLGLAIVAGIMAAHGGGVGLGTQAGWTKVLTLTFPAKPPAAAS